MDPETVDQNYAQLQQQAQQTSALIQALAGKLQTAAAAGGFGRAIMTGAGFGIGDDIINKIF